MNNKKEPETLDTMFGVPVTAQIRLQIYTQMQNRILHSPPIIYTDNQFVTEKLDEFHTRNKRLSEILLHFKGQSISSIGDETLEMLDYACEMHKDMQTFLQEHYGYTAAWGEIDVNENMAPIAKNLYNIFQSALQLQVLKESDFRRLHEQYKYDLVELMEYIPMRRSYWIKQKQKYTKLEEPLTGEDTKLEEPLTREDTKFAKIAWFVREYLSKSPVLDVLKRLRRR